MHETEYINIFTLLPVWEVYLISRTYLKDKKGILLDLRLILTGKKRQLSDVVRFSQRGSQ